MPTPANEPLPPPRLPPSPPRRLPCSAISLPYGASGRRGQRGPGEGTGGSELSILSPAPGHTHSEAGIRKSKSNAASAVCGLTVLYCLLFSDLRRKWR